MDGTVHFNGGDEVNILPFVYPCGTVSVSSLVFFPSVGSYSKTYHHYLPLSLSKHATFKSISRRRGGGDKNL